MARIWRAPGSGLGQLRQIGSTTSKLVNEDVDFDPVTGMAPQSGIPINIRAVPAGQETGATP